MKEIEKTKDNIRVSQLDESQRKKLYQKFVDAGGEVQSESQARRNLMIDRDKQREHQRKLNEHYSRVKKDTDTTRRKASGSYVRQPIKTAKREEVPFKNFRIRMRLRFQGITGFNTLFFKNRFLNNLSFKYKPALMEIQNIYLALFKQNPGKGKQVIMRLDKITPLYYELIQKTGDLYDPIELRELSENIDNYPGIPRQLVDLKDPLISLFRSLYILKPYENTINTSFERAIDIYQHLDEEKSSIVFKKKDVRNSLYVIFCILYPRLHTLFCNYYSTLFEEIDNLIEEYLEIVPAEKPGNRIRYDLTEKKLDVEEEVPEEKVIEQPAKVLDPSVGEGLRDMYKLDFNVLRKIYDKKGTYSLLSDNDKILLTYLLFLEFESEYSFILTTNRIKYNIDYLNSNKINYKSNMQELFNAMRKSQQAFENYHDAFIDYNKMKQQRPFSSDQYINYSKRVDELAKKKDSAGTNARGVIKNFMERTASELDVLVKDMDAQQLYISNPQDKIEINPEIEGEKKLHGHKIYEALTIVRNYAAAFAFRLGPEGDLYGKQDFSKDDDQDKQSGEKPGDKSGKTESILDELEDII